jgi:uncharacterized protein (TIGR02646 family)
MTSVHLKKPDRRLVAPQAKYTLYRADLRQDFHGRCGYCDDADERVDRSLFHIDHFAPQKRFDQRRQSYENLVYSCRVCNVCKGNHWVGNDPDVPNDGKAGFVDPCASDYDDHLARDSGGRIVAKTDLGAYIIGRLKLGLVRHELLWSARKNRELREEIVALKTRLTAAGAPRSDPRLLDLADAFYELTTAIDAYELAAVA